METVEGSPLPPLGDTETWKRLFAERLASTAAKAEGEKIRSTGKRTQARPNGEDSFWWEENGPKFVQNFIDWRLAHADWELWITPNGEPASELFLEVDLGAATVKAQIDRVYIRPDGELEVVDLKTGARKQKGLLQLAVYAAALEAEFGVRPEWGAYLDGRKSELVGEQRLSSFPLWKLEELFTSFLIQRDSGIIVANPTDHCKWCDFNRHCDWNGVAI